MTILRRALLFLAVAMIGCVLGANLYNSAVDAPNWGASIPASVATARQYYAVANPGTYFRVLSPAAQAAALLVLLATWALGGSLRWLAAAALGLLIAADVLTFAYFYPRNDLLFTATTAPDVLSTAWSQWSSMNHFRSAVVAAALLCELAALSSYERLRS